MNLVHLPTYGWNPLGQEQKTPTPGYSAPSTVTAQPPPYAGSMVVKTKPGWVHRAVSTFLSVYLFVYFGVYLL